MFFTPVHTHVYRNPAALRNMDRSLERFVNNTVRTQHNLNMTQDEQTWSLSLDVPGLAREELTIGIEANVVRVDSKADAKRNFKAAYELPQDIEPAGSEAKLENGVLTLKLQKKLPVVNVTHLTVN
jgi:HSP20 family protein